VNGIDTGGRRVVVAEFVTLDGYIVGPDEDISWVAEAFDARMADDIARDLDGRYDLFVFGRVTYDMFAGYWPNAVPYGDGDALAPSEGKEDPRIIAALNDRPKVVFSTTLTEASWAHTRVVRGDVAGEVRRLRAEPGTALLVQGSATVVAALAAADLVDEYRLTVHPVRLGAGTPLFPVPMGAGRQDFTLTDLIRYDNGVLATTYERRNGASR
jgi:dihydrofolate reductase